MYVTSELLVLPMAGVTARASTFYVHLPDRRGRCARWTRHGRPWRQQRIAQGFNKNSHGMETLATVRAGQAL